MPCPSSARCGMEKHTSAPALLKASTNTVVPLTPSQSKSPKTCTFSWVSMAFASLAAAFCISCMRNGSGKSDNAGVKKASCSDRPLALSKPCHALNGLSATSGSCRHCRVRPFLVLFPWQSKVIICQHHSTLGCLITFHCFLSIFRV